MSDRSDDILRAEREAEIADMEFMPDGFAFLTHSSGETMSCMVEDGMLEITAFDDNGDEVASMALPFDDWIKLMKEQR